MGKQIKVLMVEDDENDALLIADEIKRGGYDLVFERVENSLQLKKMLTDKQWDIVLADYKLPQFSAPEALEVVKEKNVDLPFIVISGNIGEESAVKMVKKGANDYLLKGKLARLSVAIEREIKDAKSRAEHRLAQEELKILKDELELKVEQRTAALMQAQENLIQAGKLALIGQLTAGVAHEVNNPLGMVKSNMSRLEEYMDILSDLKKREEDIKYLISQTNSKTAKIALDKIFEFKKENDIDLILQEYKDIFKEINYGINRMQRIVSDLVSFSHKDSEEKVGININKILDSAVEFAWNEIRYKCEVKREYGVIPLIKGSLHKMEQVFVNIIMNAIQAIDNKGIIFIRTFLRNDNLHVEIEDNGKGISQENIGKLFEPFFTTKKAGQGTGLGLSISYDIIKAHNGEIIVSSQKDKGTKITVVLPVKQG